MTARELLEVLIKAFGLYKVYMALYYILLSAPVVAQKYAKATAHADLGYFTSDVSMYGWLGGVLGLLLILYARPIAGWALRFQSKSN